MQKTVSLAVAAVALAASTMLPKQANATLIIYAQQAGVNGGAITQIASGVDFSSASFNGTYGDFTLTLLGAASTNSPSLSSLLSAAVRLRNNATDFRTISLYASQDNYSLPAGTPLQVESGLSGTVNTGTLTGTGVFQAYLDRNNAQLGTSDFTNGPQNVTFNGSTFDTGSAFGTFNRTNPLYSITSRFTATVSGGGEGNFSSHVNVAPVPEPSGVAMAGMAMVAGVGCLWRRRATQVV